MKSESIKPKIHYCGDGYKGSVRKIVREFWDFAENRTIRKAVKFCGTCGKELR